VPVVADVGNDYAGPDHQELKTTHPHKKLIVAPRSRTDRAGFAGSTKRVVRDGPPDLPTGSPADADEIVSSNRGLVSTVRVNTRTACRPFGPNGARLWSGMIQSRRSDAGQSRFTIAISELALRNARDAKVETGFLRSHSKIY
jgi:hypothetical protein